MNRQLALLVLALIDAALVACARQDSPSGQEEVLSGQLHNPVAVDGWNETDLLLADGRRVPLPGFDSIPDRPDFLALATRHGVEVDADGRVYGLLSLAFGCGDAPQPRSFEERRVDLADFLRLLETADAPSAHERR